MRYKFLAAFAALILSLSGQSVIAAEKTAAQTELQDLVTKIRAKMKEDKKTEADLADEIKQFDVLLEKHQGEKTDDVAHILMMKASLYGEVFKDEKKRDEIMEKLKHDFPDTETVKGLAARAEAEKVSANLSPGKKFPDFEAKDTAGKPLSIAGYKGKVVLVDFWATWCPPCRGEVPNVVKTYEKYHDKGFEIIGISLDQDQQKLASYTKEQKMTWRQYFDGKGWGNKLAAKYGIQSIPATFLLDGEGTIIGKGLREEALGDAVAKALAKK
jgi:peroxiredoxin